MFQYMGFIVALLVKGSHQTPEIISSNPSKGRYATLK